MNFLPGALVAYLLMAQALLAQSHSPTARAEVAGRKAQQSAWTPGVSQPVEATLGLDQEIYLLQESLPFFVRSTTQPLYTTNAFFDFTESDDWLIQQFVAAGAETIIAERYFVLAEVNTSLTRYDQFDALDRETLGVRMAAEASLTDAIFAGVTYQSTWFFQDGYGDNDSTFHSLSLHGTWSAPLPAGATMQWTPSITRFWAEPGDYDQTGIGLSGALILPLGTKTRIGLIANLNQTWFDHYFQSVFDAHRRDRTFSTGFFLSHRPKDQVELQFGLDFTTNDSSLSATNLITGRKVDLYDYDLWSVYPTLQVGIQF